MDEEPIENDPRWIPFRKDSLPEPGPIWITRRITSRTKEGYAYASVEVEETYAEYLLGKTFSALDIPTHWMPRELPPKPYRTRDCIEPYF